MDYDRIRVRLHNLKLIMRQTPGISERLEKIVQMAEADLAKPQPLTTPNLDSQFAAFAIEIHRGALTLAAELFSDDLSIVRDFVLAHSKDNVFGAVVEYRVEVFDLDRGQSKDFSITRDVFWG
jgi:hypothetical protein